jgi:hypothetical protein
MLEKAKSCEETYDVIVAGGGLAGVAAAIAAAREGANVLLLERYGFLGGMATAALVNPFMAYCSKYGEGEKFNWDLIANAGLFAEMIDGLKALGGLHSNRITFHEEFLKIVLDRMVKKYRVKVLFHTFVAEASVENGCVRSVTVVSKGGIRRYRSRLFVDATGDADIAALCGCPYEVGDEEGLCQPMSLCFRMANVDTSVYSPVWGWYDGSYPGDSDSCREQVNRYYGEKVASGELRYNDGGVSTFASCIPGVIHFNTTHVLGVQPMDVEAMTEAEMTGREQMLEVCNLMKECAPGFEHAQLMSSGAQIGVRESRRIVGDVIIREEDILGCTKFPDSIARGTYCIDVHSVKKGVSTGGMRDIPYNDYYTIPYRALLPQGITNLIVAGRPISSTHVAHGAHRVMPICASVGEGAGVAASIALREGDDFRKVPVEKVQAILHGHQALY